MAIMLSCEMKLLFVFLISFFVIRTDCESGISRWKQYKVLHDKDYKEKTDGGKHDNYRKMIFLQRDAKIQKHNSGNHSFQLGHNKFSDMTDEELAIRLGTVSTPNTGLQKSLTVRIRRRAPLPASLDYRKSFCLAPIKAQGSCGSCWAFTAIAPLEFDRCRKSKSLSLLSEQQLVDCDTGSSNQGCRGGWYTTAWSHLQAVNGSARQFCYPYVGSQGECKFCAECESMIGAKVASFGYVQTENATAMQEALHEYGPLATAITVIGTFYSYAMGVYDDAACDKLDVNHGVVIVGYGNFNRTIKHWIVRNTWGIDWGMKGYILMKRGVNKCSIETYAAFVVSF